MSSSRRLCLAAALSELTWRFKYFYCIVLYYKTSSNTSSNSNRTAADSSSENNVDDFGYGYHMCSKLYFFVCYF